MLNTVSSQANTAAGSAPAKPVTIGLLGLGTVGAGVYKILANNPSVKITRIAVRDLNKARSVAQLPADLLTTDVEAILADPTIQLVVEVMGGKEFPYEVIKKALAAGKHVVTANKVVIAHHGPELFALAEANGVNLLFEAAVAGGIPIILPLKTSLAGNKVLQIAGILNGTTNYILTRMEQSGLDFATALKEAQDKGFAEADPTADVEGHDAACKIAILAAIAFQQQLQLSQVFTEGISRIGALDIEMARALGYAIRLIGLAKATDSTHADVRVHPMLVPLTHPLSKITFENNAIWVQGDAVGDVMFYGKGAGEMPTASAVTGDILLIANAVLNGQSSLAGLHFGTPAVGEIRPVSETQNAYYIRLEADDEPGVIGHLGMACGEHNVSLDAIMQRGTDPEQNSATIVMLTHTVSEADMQAALQAMQGQGTTRRVECVLRVFQP